MSLVQHDLQILYPLPMALVMGLLRYLFEKYILTPLAKRLGIKPLPVTKNQVLENAFKASEDWNRKQILQISIKSNMSERDVERWLRLRKNSIKKHSKLDKFCENCWKLLYYTMIFSYGFVVMWNKPWFWDISKCWDDIHNQIVTTDIWLYYMVPLSFYWSLLVTQFFDVKRKDFWEMFAHHVITIVLMSLSWIFRFIRIGTLVLLVHDFSDIFLEAAKVTHYAKLNKLRDICFGMFAVSWLVTRLGIYPLWIIWDCIVDESGASPAAYYTFNSLLIMLLILHCFWTCLLGKFIMISFIPGKMNKDIRSGSESEGDHVKSKYFFGLEV
ncbi:unnamed protein product [Psylliodes chrysocephalus]|uniref:TLC domain-containing protein n=1 Tax=Psylliodes chrysocephalus TaxID=3402493 RepID=A0A9P0D2H5_9CUCU|nr:unnamed protein product [Psylliodes chrysocephala]